MKWIANTDNREPWPCWADEQGFVKGRPKATAKHTVEELEKMGLDGIYDPNAEPEEKS